MRRRPLIAGTLAALAAPQVARAATDQIRVAIFNVTTTLPFHVAQTRGIFAAQGIEAVPILLQTPPLIVQAMITGDADATTNLVTIEAANINLRRPGTALFFALNGQNAQYRMEQFLVRPQSTARTLADLRGARILSAPGPANLSAARFVLRTVGLEENRDYTLTEQALNLHVGSLAAGSFDAAYTLEPVATIAIRQGAARLLEAGVISTHLLGRTEALNYASGAAVTEKFARERPDVARRYAEAWRQAIGMIRTDPSVKALFATHMNTPAAMADAVPLLNFRMLEEMGPPDIEEFQRFIDIAVQQGVVRERVDVNTMLRRL
jgi:NitT/TauT family transport system substrate-binding protein